MFLALKLSRHFDSPLGSEFSPRIFIQDNHCIGFQMTKVPGQPGGNILRLYSGHHCAPPASPQPGLFLCTLGLIRALIPICSKVPFFLGENWKLNHRMTLKIFCHYFYSPALSVNMGICSTSGKYLRRKRQGAMAKPRSASAGSYECKVDDFSHREQKQRDRLIPNQLPGLEPTWRGKWHPHIQFLSFSWRTCIESEDFPSKWNSKLPVFLSLCAAPDGIIHDDHARTKDTVTRQRQPQRRSCRQPHRL